MRARKSALQENEPFEPLNFRFFLSGGRCRGEEAFLRAAAPLSDALGGTICEIGVAAEGGASALFLADCPGNSGVEDCPGISGVRRVHLFARGDAWERRSVEGRGTPTP